MNLNNIEKKTMPLTFRNEANAEKGKTIHILTPSKAMFDSLLGETTSESTVQVKFDNSYQKAAELMSRNTENEIITKEWLETQLDIEEISLFYNEYTTFVMTIKESPN